MKISRLILSLSILMLLTTCDKIFAMKRKRVTFEDPKQAAKVLRAAKKRKFSFAGKQEIPIRKQTTKKAKKAKVVPENDQGLAKDYLHSPDNTPYLGRSYPKGIDDLVPGDVLFDLPSVDQEAEAEKVCVARCRKNLSDTLHDVCEKLKRLEADEPGFGEQAIDIFRSLENASKIVLSDDYKRVCEAINLVKESFKRQICSHDLELDSYKRFVYPICFLLRILKSHMFYVFETKKFSVQDRLREMIDVEKEVEWLHNMYKKGGDDDTLWPEKKDTPFGLDMRENMLIWAAEVGNIKLARFLIQELEADVSRESFDASPLFYACLHGDVDMVRFLIDNGARVNMRNTANGTPLYWAVYGAKKRDTSRVVAYLIENGADLHVARYDDDGFTPFALAAKNGYFGIMECFFRSKRFSLRACCSSDECESDKRNFDCIFNTINAVVENNTDEIFILKVIIYLLDESCIDINACSPCNGSVLHIAAFYGFVNVVKYLVEKRSADVNVVDAKGDTLLHCLMYKVSLGQEVEKVLHLIDYLVARGADLNVVNARGDTLLHRLMYKASLGQEVETVLCLIDHLVARGADLNIANVRGDTPLLFALQLKDFSSQATCVILRLIRLGADPNLVSKRGETALYWAASKVPLGIAKASDIAKALVFSGAQVDVQSIIACAGRKGSKFLKFARELQRSNFNNKALRLILACAMGEIRAFWIFYNILLGGFLSECLSKGYEQVDLANSDYCNFCRLLDGALTRERRVCLEHLFNAKRGEGPGFDEVLQKIRSLIQFEKGMSLVAYMSELLKKRNYLPLFMERFIRNLKKLEEKYEFSRKLEEKYEFSRKLEVGL